MQSERQYGLRWRAALAIGFLIVVIGMMNTMPNIPFLLWTPDFDDHLLKPAMFGLFMLIILFANGFSANQKKMVWWRVALDLLFILSVLAFLLAYLDRKETLDYDFFGAETQPQNFEQLDPEAAALAAAMGITADTAETETLSIANPPSWTISAVIAGIIFFLLMNLRVWGAPVALFSILIVAYALLTWLGDITGATTGSTYWSTRLANPATYMQELLTNDQRGILGQFLNVLLAVVFPYIVLGALFGASAGGQSLIKLAVLITRKLAGGPAHAAIVSSALFGTVSGGPVVNVLSTGTLTIPMMVKRQFKPVFAAGVEAAASSGGQIMPPVMGIAAFLLASLTGEGYTNVALAALIPAVLYFASLFLTVIYESRKLKIEPVGDISENMRLSRQDYLNLITIFVPIGIIIFTLIFSGNERAAGWYAAMSLLPLAFLDPSIRGAPQKLLIALGDGGVLMARLFLLFLAVSLVDAGLNITGFPIDFKNSALALIEVMRTMTLFGVEYEVPLGPYLFLTLLIGMIAAIILGMGMPTLPAYANAALIMAPVLGSLGVSIFTAHLFVFYFAAASAITPPVAIAAFAAGSVANTEPMRTGFSAVRVGAVMFIVPFIFAFYPELLWIDGAIATDGVPIAMRPDGYDWTQFVTILLRLPLVLLLLASGLARYDRTALSTKSAALRLALACGVLATSVYVYVPAVCLALLVLLLHRKQKKPLVSA